MKKVKIGVLGGYRGTVMINYSKVADNAELVAICDNNPDVLAEQKEHCKGYDIAYYDNFEDFIKADMDAVVLANYANEHAPFAVKALKAGKHVYSEVLPVQTMKEAVELIEAVEETGKIYAYAANSCYMPVAAEMKRLYQENKIGEFEYGECEYIHNGEPIWPDITYGDRNHWRNHMYSTFYCTHSLGPIIHATKLRPVSVIGFEGTLNERGLRTGRMGGQFGIEAVTLENGGLVKSIHGGLYVNSIWYSMYGSKGRMECPRETENPQNISEILVDSDEYSGAYNIKHEHYKPEREFDKEFGHSGHGGSDFYANYNFVEKVKGNPNADIIDVYEAMDMFLPGMFAFRSILDGGKSKDIPNLRNKCEREKWRNDTACTDPRAAGDMLLPTQKNGTPDIPDEVYESVKRTFEKHKNDTDGYRAMAFSQSDTKK